MFSISKLHSTDNIVNVFDILVQSKLFSLITFIVIKF